MRNKKKKNDGLPSLKNSILVSGLKGGRLRLMTTSELSEDTLETSVLIVETLSGALPLMPKEEALQTCYDSLFGATIDFDFNALGRYLANLAPGGETLQ